MELLKEMQREALAYISLCDLYIERSYFENNHFKNILTIKSEKKKEIEEKIGNKFIQIYKSTNLDINKYIFMQYDKAKSSVQLKNILIGCDEIESVTIIISEMNEWYEGLYGEKKAVKGVYFEKTLLEIIDKSEEIDCPANKVMLVCSKKKLKLDKYEIPGYDIVFYDSYQISEGYVVTRYTICKKEGENIMNLTFQNIHNSQFQVNTNNSIQNMQEKKMYHTMKF